MSTFPERSVVTGPVESGPLRARPMHAARRPVAASPSVSAAGTPSRFADSHRAAHAERLAHLAEFLPPADRQVIAAIYQRGESITSLALLMGVTSDHLRRRVARLTRRMQSPEFAFVALRSNAWSPPLSSVATLCVLHGRSLRCAAEHLHLTVHAVRRFRDLALAMARGAQDTTALLDASGDGVDRRWRRGARDHDHDRDHDHPHRR